MTDQSGVLLDVDDARKMLSLLRRFIDVLDTLGLPSRLEQATANTLADAITATGAEP